jgi:hypothetical protein
MQISPLQGSGVYFDPLPQGVALGCHISPLSGLKTPPPAE